MKFIQRFLLILPWACHFSLALASPTSSDYLPCHKMASLTLMECLTKNPGDNDHCWSQARSTHATCYANVNKSYQPDRERIEAQKKAMEKHGK